MPENWKTYKLGECISLRRGHDLPIADADGGEYPICGSSGIIGYHSQMKSKSPGLVLGRSGNSMGRAHFLQQDYWPHNTVMYVTNFHDNDPKYFYYLLDGIDFKVYNSGSAVPSLNRNYIAGISISIPPLPEQHAIASILSALDDKIENNLAMNKTLEDIAMALYKHWFVDFGPFQDGHFIDSELGLIPEGWEVLTYSDITDRITDGAHHSPKKMEEGYPMPSVKDMGDWGFDLKSCKKINKADYIKLVQQGCQPQQNDVVIAKDGSWLKHAFVIEKDLPIVLLSSIAILRPNGLLNSHLLNLNLRLDTTKQRMASIVTGAVIQRIVLKDFRKFKVIVPNQITQRKACGKIIPLIEKCWKNNRENITLSQLRDTLLPKLISGEIRVKDVEKMVSEAL